jgi:hypothetical protein
MNEYSCSAHLNQNVDGQLLVVSRELHSLLLDVITRAGQSRPATSREADMRAWSIYLGVLEFGTSRATVNCVMHKMAREARIMLRQSAEYLIKLEYFIRNPEEAEFQSANRPSEFVRLASDAALSEEALAEMQRDLAVAQAKNSDIGKRQPKSILAMLESIEPEARKAYAHMYRWPSQTMHASIVGMTEICLPLPDGRVGIDFDGANIDSNELLALLCLSNRMFIESFAAYFDLELPKRAESYDHVLQEIDKRLGLNVPG